MEELDQLSIEKAAVFSFGAMLLALGGCDKILGLAHYYSDAETLMAGEKSKYGELISASRAHLSQLDSDSPLQSTELAKLIGVMLRISPE